MRAPINVARTLKAVQFALGLAAAVIPLFVACGSKDDRRKLEPTDGGAGGEPTMFAGGGTPSAGVPAMGAGEGGMPVAGGAAPAPGGSGGSSGEGGVSAEGGVSGEGGAGGAVAEISCERATTCSNDLSGLGLEDFSIAFSIQTTATVGSGILSQRQICMRSRFWDIRLRNGGTSISVELDDASNYTDLTAPMVINDGAAHEVRVCRKSGHVYVFADGELVVDGPNATAFTTLVPLTTKTTQCMSLDGTVTLDGTVSDVCIGAL
ncbi:MAG: hypothetical protein K0R38_2892 [Polyangiaceae bacterium]|nr:hypothetical protein [Polyangiaceae bacterium]